MELTVTVQVKKKKKILEAMILKAFDALCKPSITVIKNMKLSLIMHVSLIKITDLYNTDWFTHPVTCSEALKSTEMLYWEYQDGSQSGV